MKKVRNMFLVLVVAVFALSACDIVEEPYIQGGGDTPTPDPGDTVMVMKKVLLEDYTGVRCVNCPAAGELALQLQEIYPQVIVMGVHAGMLAMPNGGYPDFRTTEGTEWWNYFGFDMNPIGTVNRTLSGSGRYGLNPGDWATFVIDEIAKDPVIALEIVNAYDEDSRNLNVKVSGKVLQDQTDELYLVVCLMEDDIEGMQQTSEGVNPNYLHRHVFRGTLDGKAWGSIIDSPPFAEGYIFEEIYNYTLPEDFVAYNCAVIAYVYQNSNMAILQVEEAEVMGFE